MLTNWVAKTANLLVEELDAGPGTTVALDLPPHWKHLVWALAVWSVGCRAGAPATTTRPTCSCPPARTTGPGRSWSRWPCRAWPAGSTPLPPAGWLDWAAEVAGFGDVLPPVGPLDHADLLAAARARGLPAGARVLADGPLDLLAALVADGSVVVAGRPLTEGERASELLSG